MWLWTAAFLSYGATLALAAALMWNFWKHKHSRLERLEKKIMADFSKLDSSVATLKADAEALIAFKQAEDPAIQAGIDAAQASVDAVDTEVKAALPPA